LAIRLLAPFRETPEYFHWSQQRLAFVKTLIYTLDFTRPNTLTLVEQSQHIFSSPDDVDSMKCHHLIAIAGTER
jgi:hypothetical protein